MRAHKRAAGKTSCRRRTFLAVGGSRARKSVAAKVDEEKSSFSVKFARKTTGF